MKNPLFPSALALLVSLCAPAFAGTTLSFDGQQIVVDHDGTRVSLSPREVPPLQVRNASGQKPADPPLWVCGIGEDTPTDNHARFPLAAGLYLFDAAGRQIAFAPSASAEYASEARLSPDGSILALDTGVDLIRSWEFFRLAGLSPLGRIDYLTHEDAPNLIWIGADAVLVSSMQTEEHGRACGYDPCGPVSVREYAFANRQTSTIFAGTDRCDYTLQDYQPQTGVVTATRLCLPSPQAWETYPENMPTDRVEKRISPVR